MIPFLRPLLRRPGDPLLAILVLAVGLATSVATFTYIRAFEQPFPGVEAEGMVRLFEQRDDQAFADIPYLDYLDYMEASSTLELGAVQRGYAASVRHESSAEVQRIEAVAGEFFSVLRARAHIGRLLGPEDDRPEAPPAAVIAHAWWVSAFGASEDVLGRTLILNFQPFTVVGVAAPEFLGSNADRRPGVWIPIAHFRKRYTGWHAQAQNRDIPLTTVLGRLRDGATMTSTQAEITGLAEGLEAAYPRAEEPRRLSVQPAVWIDPSARADESGTTRMMTIAAIGFLLLVCANVANVLLSIASTEGRANAIRAAIGASPGRVAGEALGRNVLLSVLAWGAAMALTIPLVDRLGDYFARPTVWAATVSRDFPVDASIVFFGMMLALATGLIASAPSLRAAFSSSPRAAMTPDADVQARPVRAGLRMTLRDGMIAVQSALAVALLVLSGLVLRTFSEAGQIDPGFESDNLVGALVSVSSMGIERTETRTFFDGLMQELESQPWVQEVSNGDRLPLAGRPLMSMRAPDASEPVQLLFERVRHDFLPTLGLDVLDGRGFELSDEGLVDRILINQSAAGQLFPAGDAVGGTLFQLGGDQERPLQVVGVVSDSKIRDLLADPEPAVFALFDDVTWPTSNSLIIRTRGDATARMAGDLRRLLSEYAPHMTIINVVAFNEIIGGALYAQRMNAELFTGMALLGLALACAGIFSVVSLSVKRRRREIGIRKAMGATETRIRNHMMGRALTPVVIGCAIGLGVSLLGARLVESLLFGVSPLDPAAIAFGVLGLLTASAGAAAIPAWRASRGTVRDALRA
jgi:predicted permease